MHNEEEAVHEEEAAREEAKPKRRWFGKGRQEEEEDDAPEPEEEKTLLSEFAIDVKAGANGRYAVSVICLVLWTAGALPRFITPLHDLLERALSANAFWFYDNVGWILLLALGAALFLLSRRGHSVYCKVRLYEEGVALIHEEANGAEFLIKREDAQAFVVHKEGKRFLALRGAPIRGKIMLDMQAIEQADELVQALEAQGYLREEGQING